MRHAFVVATILACVGACTQQEDAQSIPIAAPASPTANPAFPVTTLAPNPNAGVLQCPILQRQVFAPQGQTVALVSGHSQAQDGKFVVFSSRLRVNTDGAPNSYHPEDLAGQTKAINHIANGVSVYDTRGTRERKLNSADTVRRFAEFRDNDWHPIPGHRIVWQNVLDASRAGSLEVPCVFQTGEHAGYFGSLTRLKNGLPSASAGECHVRDQLDERFVPALVMAGGNNPLRSFGAAPGDLVLAVNPANGRVQAAVIGDSGPPDNLGEGSVALNMALLGRSDQPRTYAEAKELDTGNQRITVAVIPGSRRFQLERPYSAANIQARSASWATSHGYASVEDFARQVSACGQAVGG
jgi:hypothetical protein